MARFKMTREMQIPADFKIIKADEETGVLVASDESGLRVIAFAGRAQKPAFGLRFRTVERATQYVADWFAGIQSRAESKRAEREARKGGHSYQVGDVLMSSWGYDQTNIDFYEVVALVGSCTLELRELAQERSESGIGMQGGCIPVVGSYIAETIRRRVTAHGSVKISACQRASMADFKVICGAKIYSPVAWSSYA